MFKFLPLLLLLFCCACEGKTAARKAARGTNFVPDPNHLFFKNTRARHYDAEEITNRATIYRHNELFRSEANLRLTLIDNWLQDRAIIRFELPAPISESSDWSLRIKQKNGQHKALSFSSPPTNKELDHLMDALNRKEELFIRTQLDTILPAFPQDKDRKHARIVIKDYLTLVGH